MLLEGMVEPRTGQDGHARGQALGMAARDVLVDYAEDMVEWIVIGVLYAFGLLFFQLLGGISAAGRAIERWGHESSVRRLERSGLTPESFARSRLRH
jgi:hypothetical protein